MYEINKINKKKIKAFYAIKFLTFFAYIILVPIIIINLIITVKHLINPSEIPQIFGVKIFEIISKSMEETINKEDVILVKNVHKEQINNGDIISFNRENEIVTHRIIKIEIDKNGEEIYTTKGDNNKFEDKQKIRYSQIEGKYIFKFPKLGIIKYLLPMLFIFLIFYIIHVVKVNQRKKQREKRVKELKIKDI